MQLDERFVLTVLPKAVTFYNNFPKDPSFSIDTRSMKEGDIFVAISGSTSDGHAFLGDAVTKKASGFIVDQDKIDLLKPYQDYVKKGFVIAVPNAFDAFIALASAWRALFEKPIIAVTGTVGKTSTKELISQILKEARMEHIASRANENTILGAALNIFKLRKEHQAAVFEIGISNRGEMADIVEMVRPTTAVITNIGHQHMDGLGSLHDIAIEKRTIFKYFTEESIGIVNGDQSLLADVAYLHPVVKFGSKTTNQIQARKIRFNDSGVQFILKIYGEKYSVTIPRPHTGSVFNALAAAAAAHLLSIPHDCILRAIQQSVVVEGRFEEKKIKTGGTLIHDCYNANPESMKSALMAFQLIKTDSKKIAVIGDMLGLGISSPFWHRQIGRFLRKISSVNRVILVGSLVSWIQKTAPLTVAIDRVDTWQNAKQLLEKEIDESVVVLVKGSHDTGLYKMVEELT